MESKDYLILRKGGDIDLLTKKGSFEKVVKSFEEKGYLNISSRYFHVGLGKIIPKLELIDLQKKGLNQNKLIFFPENYFFNEKYKKRVIINLALLLHLIVNKGKVTKKRKRELFYNFKKLSHKEKENFFDICLKEYGKKITTTIRKIMKNEKVSIIKLKWKIIFKKSNFLQIIELPFILLFNQIYKFKQKRKKYIITFLGVDGSGKTTTIDNLSRYLIKNTINHKKGNLGVYHQRSRFMKVLSIFIKKEKDKAKAQNKLNINYTKKSPLKNLIRIIDIYIRYKQTLKDAKKKGAKIIIFDRYFYDLILQSKKDFFSRCLLMIMPKPDKLFFLYFDPKELFKRKKERNPKALKEQIDKFRMEIKGICKIKEVETKTEKQTLKEILIELSNKGFLRCI